MKQYLLAVHSVEGEPTPSPETIEQMYRDVEAVNVSRRDRRAAVALAVVDSLDLDDYQPYQVTRADLLARLGGQREAAQAYDRALELTSNAVEHAHLRPRRQSLAGLDQN